MDTSPEYIKLCKPAISLQKLWKPAVGDFYYSPLSADKCVKVIMLDNGHRTNKVWLPRADQLFTLLEARYNVPGKPAYALNKFHQYVMAYSPHYCRSVEQMLLQFVMHEVFGLCYRSHIWQPLPPKLDLQCSV